MKTIQTILAAATMVLSGASAEEWQPMTPERHAHIQSTKSQRMAERRERVRKALATPGSKLNRLSDAEMADITTAAVNKEVIEASVKGGQGWEDKVSSLQKEGGRALEGEEHQWIRKVNVDADKGRLLWGNGASGYDPYAANAGLASETQYYDKWQQAYRFLGGFIDCDHSWSQGSHDRNDNRNNNNNNKNQGGQACSRWMMWAAVSLIWVAFCGVDLCRYCLCLVALCEIGSQMCTCWSGFPEVFNRIVLTHCSHLIFNYNCYATVY
jgi:hypothetical protein